MESHAVYRLLLIALIIVMNAFFSGSEVALLSTRKSRLRALAENAHLRAGLNIHSGQVTNKAVADSLGLTFVPPEQAVAA